MTGNRRAALLLAPEAPYPLAGGGALRTASLLEHLTRSYAVDLVVFREVGAPDPRSSIPAGRVRDVFVLDLPRHGRSAAAKVARNAVRLARQRPPLVDRFSGFGKAMADALEGRKYAIGVIEHFWCAPYWEQIAPLCERTALDLHNVESRLHARCAASEPGAQAFAHRVFERAARELEADLLPRFSEVLAASENDAAAVEAIAPRARVRVYPNAIPFRPVPERVMEHAIVFTGNMEYHPNVTAVRFFRREIWPLLRERWPKLVWRLVGKNDWAVRRYASGDPRIEVLGEVEDAVAEIARAEAAVVPLLAGSGTRLKIIEAWAAATPVVSTTVGAEGLGARDSEHLLLADSPSGFAEATSRLLACKNLRDRLGLAGRLLMENDFTWEAAWKRLDF